MKKLLSIVVAFAVFLSLFITALNADAQTVANPNEAAAQIGSVQAIRNSLNLVWSDEFGGDIGCGAQRQALATTNGTDASGNPTSNEVRKSAKWSHERYRDGTPITRHGQLQHYVAEDGRNSWTEDGVLHIRGQREEQPYTDPTTNKSYAWTADSLLSSYFDEEKGQTNLQAFRFGMMEARIYTVNGKALEDSNGNPVLDKDGNIQQDPKYSQGLWNGFWTIGLPDMNKDSAYVRNSNEKRTWPYCGEIDIDEAFTSPTSYSTYNSATAKTDCDENGIIISYSSKAKIKYDENGKILITNTSDTPIVTYNSETSSYKVAEGYTSDYIVSGEEITISAKAHIVKQDENGKTYISDSKNKTIVDTNGNCYGSSTLATGQLHYRTGERYDGTLVTGTTENKKTEGLGGGYKVSTGNAGAAMLGDTGYHTYGVYWTPEYLVYYYDDLIVGYHDITDPQYFQLRECPQYLYLTFPIGGSVPSDPNPALDYADYLVDYVRIYQADDGYNTNASYQGSLGFPQLNDLDQPVSYYNEATNAYSKIKIINLYNSCELSSGADKYVSWAAPFRTNGKLCRLKSSSATIKTQEKVKEGKYDVYVTGLSRSNSKECSFTLNGVGVGTQLNLSDYAKDKYDREYSSAKSCYIGTVDITNGAHNLEIGVNETKSGSNNALLYSLVLVENNNSVATVTVSEDTPLESGEPSSASPSSTEPSSTVPTEPIETITATPPASDDVVTNLTKNVNYKTFGAATSAASDGDELLILADVETTTTGNEGCPNKTLTVDLNGHTLTAKCARFASSASGKTVTYKNGNIVLDNSTKTEAGFFVRENSTLNLIDINLSMSTSSSAPTYGAISLKKSSSNALCNINITRCTITSKAAAIDCNDITKYNITITDSKITGTDVFKGMGQTDEATVSISDSTISKSSNFVNTSSNSLAAIVVPENQLVYNSSDNLIENIILDTRKLNPGVYTNYSSLTFKSVEEDLAPVTTDEAASIRLGNLNGIRFYTKFNKKAIDKFNTDNKGVEFGTLIGPLDLVGEELTIADVSSGNAANVKYSVLEYWGDNDEFVGSIVSVKEYNIARDFAGRGYVKIGDTYYYSEITSIRSLARVAYAFKNTANSGYDALDSEFKELVDAWADKLS